MEHFLEVAERLNEKEYEQAVKSVFERVFSVKCAKDWQEEKGVGKNATQKDKNDFFKKKIPVYFDAVKRGEAELLNSLNVGDIDIPLNADVVRRYTLTDEGIKWAILPKNEDPFQRMKFFSQVKDSNIPLSGKSDLWTDPFLVDLMLFKGSIEQNKLFDGFVSSMKKIDIMEKEFLPTLGYLQSLELYIKDIKSAYSILVKHPEKNKKHLYFEQFLLPRNSLIGSVLVIEECFDHVLSLHSLLKKQGETVKASNRERFEQTLVVELLTNSEIFDDPIFFEKEIETTQERAEKFNNFVKKNIACENPEEIKSKAGLTAHLFLAEHNQQLKGMFKRMRIKEELGMEYVEGLLLAKLNNITNYFLEGDRSKDLRSLYNVKIAPMTENAIAEGTIAGESLVGIDKNYAKAVFLRKLIEKEMFGEKIYFSLPAEDQAEVLEDLFNSNYLKKRETLERAILKLIEKFDLKYSVSDQMFVSKASVEKIKKYSWLPGSQIKFLELVISRLGKDPNVEIILDRIISSSIVNKEGFKKGDLREKIRNQCKEFKSKKGLDDSYEDAALKVVQYYYLEGSMPEFDWNKEVDLAIESMRFLGTLEIGFPGQKISQIRKEVRNRAEVYVKKLRELYFPDDYTENKIPFQSKILADSLVNLGNKT